MRAGFQSDATWIARLLAHVAAGAEWFFGLISLLVILAVVATIPIVQLVSLGFLLESAGRIARTGRLRDGFLLVHQAARIGSYIAGTWLMLLPLRLISDYWYSSFLIDSQSEATRNWRIGLMVATGVMIAHILTAWYSGGRFRHFFWPVLLPVSLPWWALRRVVAFVFLRSSGVSGRSAFLVRLAHEALRTKRLSEWFPPAILLAGILQGQIYRHARDAVWEFIVSLQIPRFFWLGMRGAIGTMVWLVVPILLLIAATYLPEGPGVLTGLLGGVLLAIALFYLPFLQTRFAAANRWANLFNVREVRVQFRRAPFAFAAALTVTLLFALPLYLLKIEMTPREVAFLPSLVFVVLIYPARLLTGWAVARAERRTEPRLFLWRWAAFFLELPVVGFYVLIVFLTGYTSWYGVWSLFEQHALLIPVPFLGL